MLHAHVHQHELQQQPRVVAPAETMYFDDDEEMTPTGRDRCNTWPLKNLEVPSLVVSTQFGETPEVSDTSPHSSVGSGGLSPHGGAVTVPSVGSPCKDSTDHLADLPGLPPGLATKKKTKNAWGNISYADLITQAILSSPEKRLTLAQIYEWIVQSVPYFADKADSKSSAGWKNSIRHNLSLHDRFVRIPNDDHGKSSWWMISPHANAVTKKVQGHGSGGGALGRISAMERQRADTMDAAHLHRCRRAAHAAALLNRKNQGVMHQATDEALTKRLHSTSQSSDYFSTSSDDGTPFRVRSDSMISFHTVGSDIGSEHDIDIDSDYVPACVASSYMSTATDTSPTGYGSFNAVDLLQMMNISECVKPQFQREHQQQQQTLPRLEMMPPTSMSVQLKQELIEEEPPSYHEHLQQHQQHPIMYHQKHSPVHVTSMGMEFNAGMSTMTQDSLGGGGYLAPAGLHPLHHSASYRQQQTMPGLHYAANVHAQSMPGIAHHCATPTPSPPGPACGQWQHSPEPMTHQAMFAASNGNGLPPELRDIQYDSAGVKDFGIDMASVLRTEMNAQNGRFGRPRLDFEFEPFAPL